MVAQLARQLHQNILDVEEWDVAKFFQYFGHMNTLLKLENEALAPQPEDGKATKRKRSNR